MAVFFFFLFKTIGGKFSFVEKRTGLEKDTPNWRCPVQFSQSVMSDSM